MIHKNGEIYGCISHLQIVDTTEHWSSLLRSRGDYFPLSESMLTFRDYVKTALPKISGKCGRLIQRGREKALLFFCIRPGIVC